MRGRRVWTWVLVLACACATPRRPGWERAGDAAAVADPDGARERADRLWERRDEEAALREALALYARAAAAEPEPYPVLVRASRACFLLAHAFAADEAEDARLCNEGAAWAERALAALPAFRAAVIEDGATLEEALPLIGADRVDALHWLLVNLGRWVRAQDLPTRFRYLPRLKALARRVEQLDAGFFHGGVWRFWGAFYAEAPAPAGGSLPRSLESFERALAVSGGFLETRVLLAEAWAVRERDRGRFLAELEAVIAADPDALPGVLPEQRIAQRRASELLARTEGLFR